MFPERAWVRVGLVAHFADVWFVRSVHMHVLFAVAAVREAPVASLELALKRLLAYNRE